MTAFDRLGRDVAAALKPGPGQRRARQLTALSAVDWDARRRLRRAVFAGAAVAALVAVALLWIGGGAKLPWADDTPLQIAGDAALNEGGWLRVPDARPLKLVFADGTELRLERKSTGRLSLASVTEARLTLEAGELGAWVKPASSTGRSWSFNAGPYEVLVIGTELHIDWNAEANRLSVYLARGKAQVRGGPLEPPGVTLGSGDRLQIDSGRIEIRRAAEPSGALGHASVEPSPPHADTAPFPSDESPEAPSGGPAKADSPSPAPSAASAWKTLAQAGDYRQALLAAENEGFEALAERVSAADLALLADAARLAGDGARARQALLTLRRRFPTASAAHTGAFRLGRLSLSDRNYPEAAKWFEAYLQAAPKGALASEAAGRLLEARSRAGDRLGAETAARDYLQRFPGGPYESVARALLQGDKLAPQ